MDEMERMFRPEFRNRLDSVIIFRALSRKEIGEIVVLLLAEVEERLEEHNITLTITDAAKDLLAEQGYDPDFGARPLRRLIQRLIEDALSEGILEGKFNQGDKVQADVEDGEIVLKVISSAPENLPAMPAVA